MPRNNALAPLITGDIARITTTFESPSGNSTLIQNTFDFMRAGFSPGDLTSEIVFLGAVFVNNVSTTWAAVMNGGQQLVNVTVAILSRNDIATSVQQPAFSGGLSTATVNDMLAVVAVRRTPLKGQHGRGRISLGAVPTTFFGANSNTVLTPLAYGKYVALCAVFQRDITTSPGTWTPCITTRPPKGTFLVTRAAADVIYSVDRVVGTVRRRKQGRGI